MLALLPFEFIPLCIAALCPLPFYYLPSIVVANVVAFAAILLLSLLLVMLMLLDLVPLTYLPSPTASLSLHAIIICFLLCINNKWTDENVPLLCDHVVHTLVTLGRVNGRTERKR